MQSYDLDKIMGLILVGLLAWSVVVAVAMLALALIKDHKPDAHDTRDPECINHHRHLGPDHPCPVCNPHVRLTHRNT